MIYTETQHIFLHMKTKQTTGTSVRYSLIFLQIIGLILGITSFSLVCYAYGHDVTWNNIVQGTELIPHVHKEEYFSRRRLEWQWVGADEKTELNDRILEEEELLRDSLFDPLFIAGFAILLTIAVFHLMWTFVYNVIANNLKVTVWMNLSASLLQLLLSLIVALTAGDNDEQLESVSKDIEKETADLGIGNNGTRISHGKDFKYFQRIFRVCLGQYNSSGFEIPGYGFWYDKDALTELGFCPESDVKFSAAICACFFGVLLGITALAAQISVSTAPKTASRAQVVPEQQQQGIKLKTLPTTVFGARTFPFGQFDHANLSERRECLSRQFSYHPFPRFSFPDSSFTDIRNKDFKNTENVFPETSFTNISD